MKNTPPENPKPGMDLALLPEWLAPLNVKFYAALRLRVLLRRQRAGGDNVVQHSLDHHPKTHWLLPHEKGYGE